ncbi:lactoylglutathione lyase family protein [Planococcus donghaensis]|uniref:Glyoxalase n=1 Tax=Planococcus donghaensis TaxID=414778 RepID=A0A1C7EER7_9BACL|nr:lactoylglutathione lyase family protein [Planococcus donghaensis]ANU21882.1 glyoxalase [Planococcus donghaensis]
MAYPRAFSHIGLSVTDLDKAVTFYKEVMGWYVIMEPSEVKEENDTPIGQMCIDVFGAGWGTFRIAHMSTSDGTGIEIFEFPNSEKPENNFEYWKSGVFHFCVQDPDVEGLVSKIVEHGGKQRMPIREYYPNEKPYKMCYVEDPFGIIFEVYSHSYEITYSSGVY